MRPNTHDRQPADHRPGNGQDQRAEFRREAEQDRDERGDDEHAASNRSRHRHDADVLGIGGDAGAAAAAGHASSRCRRRGRRGRDRDRGCARSSRRSALMCPRFSATSTIATGRDQHHRARHRTPAPRSAAGRTTARRRGGEVDRLAEAETVRQHEIDDDSRRCAPTQDRQAPQRGRGAQYRDQRRRPRR